jgi:acetylornithine deacetylase
MEGDVRLCPFYRVEDVKAALERYVADLNNDPTLCDTQSHGPHSKYVLPEECGGEKMAVKLTFTFPGENGIACNIDSNGFNALKKATEDVLGKVIPYSIGGSLPLIRDLQEQGFDVMIAGYGFSNKYHADNESVSIESMKKACSILSRVIADVAVE